MSFMFSGCSGLSSLDLSALDTSNVTRIRAMFSICSGLTSLNLDGFSTESITSPISGISCLFQDCTALQKLDLSSMDFSNLVFNLSDPQPYDVLENTNLDEIKSPKNLPARVRIALPYSYRAVETGTVYRYLPTGVDSSLTLIRYDPTVVESVSLNETSHDMTDADTFQLIATVTPSTAADKSVTWSSSDTGIVTVDDTGLVTGIAPGEADVTVTTTDGRHTATCHFTITHAPVPVSSVSVSPTTLTLTAGDTATLTAEVLPDNADDKSVSWSSANQSIATVSDTGTVTAVAPGTTVITVTTTDGGRTADCLPDEFCELFQNEEE